MAFRCSAVLALSYALFVLADSSGDAGGESTGDGESEDPSQSIVLAHGVLMAVLFAIFFPLGAIIIQVLQSPNAAWIHGIWQICCYLGALAGFGIGVYMATVEDKWVTGEGHAIIGTIVIGLLLLQPFGGFIHHRIYKKYGKPTTYGFIHRWSGRGLLALGVINGGLGTWLADEDKNFIIPYAVVAGVIYLSWAVVLVWKNAAKQASKTRTMSNH